MTKIKQSQPKIAYVTGFVIVLNAFSAFCVQSGLGIRFKDYVS